MMTEDCFDILPLRDERDEKIARLESTIATLQRERDEARYCVEVLRGSLIGARTVINALRTVSRSDGTVTLFDCVESRSGSLVGVAGVIDAIDGALFDAALSGDTPNG